MKGKLRIVLLVLCIMAGVLGAAGQASNAAAAHKYKICINKQMNCVTIYEKDEEGAYTKPVKAFICSTGYATPLGDFEIEIQYRWKELIHNAWGQYCSRVTWDGIIIHSVWYYGKDPSAQSTSRFNMLGTTCSSGCINLTTKDCKWIYDHCDVGTPIHIYNSENPGSLGKPTMLKVPQAANDRGYDPTDIWTPQNPYIKKQPTLRGVKNRKISYGSDYQVMDGITAKNTTGQDAAKLVETEIRFDGKVVKKLNTKKAGVYTVKYKLVDEIGRKVVKKAKITVVDRVKPVLKRVKDRTVPYGTDITEALVLEKVAAKWHKEDLTDKITVTIEQKAEDRYRVVYRVTAPNGKSAKAVCRYYIDEPEVYFEGAADRSFETYTILDETVLLEGVSAYTQEEELTDQIRTVVKQQENAEKLVYEVTYQVEYDGVLYTKTVTFTMPQKEGNAEDAQKPEEGTENPAEDAKKPEEDKDEPTDSEKEPDNATQTTESACGHS